MFEIFYASLIIIDSDLLWVVDEWEQKDAVANAVLSTILSYLIIEFIPTMLVNLCVILKEATMNQFAWSREAEENGIFFKYDLLTYFGIDENLYDYTE